MSGMKTRGFSEEFLARLRKVRLYVSGVKAGAHKGTRRSHAFGTSLEFSDYRVYQPGDDVRQIDWNVFGRTGRHYIRRYLDEQEIKAAIYLDCTASMRTLQGKWSVARQLASAFSYMILSNDDRLSFFPVAGPPSGIINRKGSVYAKSVLFSISQLEMDRTETSFFTELEKSMQKGRQISIIITDALESLDHMETVIKKLAGTRTQSIMLQILGKEELVPLWTGDIKLVDSETSREVNVSMSPRMVSAYQNRLEKHNSAVEALCMRYGMTYLLAYDTRTVEEIILKDCLLRGIVQR